MSKLKILILGITAFLISLGALQAKDHSRHDQRSTKMLERMCLTQSDRTNLDPVRIDKMNNRVANKLSLTDVQKIAFKELREVRQKAQQDMRASLCNQKLDVSTYGGRLNVQEKMMEARLVMMKTIRPSIEAFYNSLDQKQKVMFSNMPHLGSHH